MTIQWYPGHMHKAQKEIKQSIPKVDLIIEVIDARIPFSSENPLIASLRGDKPCIKVLSKSDLADMSVVKAWQEYFERERTVKTLPISVADPGKMRKLPELCKKMLPERARAVKKMRAMIVGIPNVGKSTLINTLAGRAIAKTGNEPAVTKTQQYIQLEEDFLLLDTPGILWPKQELENSSYRLAATGAIKDTAMSYDEVAFFAAEYFIAHYPDMLRARYELDVIPETALELLESIGRRRGCLGRGGHVDLTKVSEIFIRDLRSGAIGSICMETPEVVVREIAEHEKAEAIKKEQKEARQAQHKSAKRRR